LTKPDQALSRSGFVVSTFPVSSLQFTRSFIMSDTTNTFRSLFQIDVSKYVEMKGQFSYLSWPFAVAQLRLADPNAFWEVRRFDGLPYLNTELGYFVEVAVTVQGVTLSRRFIRCWITRTGLSWRPTPFDINTSIQRSLVKAIALHGLGLEYLCR
jgi:hypothetical protein